MCLEVDQPFHSLLCLDLTFSHIPLSLIKSSEQCNCPVLNLPPLILPHLRRQQLSLCFNSISPTAFLPQPSYSLFQSCDLQPFIFSIFLQCFYLLCCQFHGRRNHVDLSLFAFVVCIWLTMTSSQSSKLELFGSFVHRDVQVLIIIN